jgi:hypothetical protein
VKPAPAGLESAGKKLSPSVLSVYEPGPHELLLLERAARCAEEADLMLCKLLAELHLSAEILTELERDVVRLRQRRIGAPV